MTDTESGRVCTSCGKAIAEDDTDAMVMGEGVGDTVAWTRWIHAQCAAEAVDAKYRDETGRMPIQ